MRISLTFYFINFAKTLHMPATGVLISNFLSVEFDKTENVLNNYIYSCSHGLRSPLKSLKGLVYLLGVATPGDLNQRRKYLAMMRQCISKLQNIVIQFEELKTNLSTSLGDKRIQLNSFLQDLLSTFRSTLEFHNIKTEIHINQKGEFYADAARLSIILVELIKNAITFHDHANTNRNIILYVTASPKGCSIQVHDNGIGISCSEKNEIFNLFYRGSNNSQGIGLGLYIANAVAIKMKGTLNLGSDASEGTSFNLWIPNNDHECGGRIIF